MLRAVHARERDVTDCMRIHAHFSANRHHGFVGRGVLFGLTCHFNTLSHVTFVCAGVTA